MMQHNENKKLRFAAVWLGIAVLMPVAAFTLTSNVTSQAARLGNEVAAVAGDGSQQHMRLVEAGSQQWACVPLRELPALFGEAEPVVAAVESLYNRSYSGRPRDVESAGRTMSESLELD